MKAPIGSFEIPDEMRNMAEQSVIQARQAFESFMTATQQAAAKFEEGTTATQAGAKAAGEKIMRFAERNIAASFEVAQRLARAKDLQEMAQIQQEFLRSQMQTLSEQAKELVQGAAQSAKGGGGKKAR
jgi:phasin